MSIFVSYSRRDIEFVRRLHAALAARGRETWVDWEGIPPSADWMREIETAIAAAQAMVFVISPDSAASVVCADELRAAEQGHKRLVPVLFRPVDPAAVPAAAARLNWVMLRAEDDFEAAVARLLEAVDTDLAWVESHTRLLVRAREWEARGREPSLTLRGADLKAAEEAIATGASKQPPPNELQTRYVIESRHAATRRRTIALGSGAVAAVVIAVLGLQWQTQRAEAQRQEANALARRLASAAERQRERPWTGTNAELPTITGLQLLAHALKEQASFAQRSLEVDIEARRMLRLVPPLERRLDATGSLLKEWVGALAFRPDGRLVAARARGAFETWAPGTGESGGATPEAGGDESELVFAPDGATAVSMRRIDDSLTVFDTATGRPLRRLRYPGETPASFAVGPGSPGGLDLLLTLTRRVDDQERHRTLRLADVRAADTAPVELAGLPALFWPAISPDGRVVVGSLPAGEGYVAKAWAMDALRRGDTTPLAELGRVLMPVFSPDGTQLAMAHDGDPPALVIVAVDGWKELQRLPRGRPLALGPGGRLVAVAGENEYVVRVVSTADDIERARIHTSMPHAPAAFSADGAQLAVGGAGRVELWRLDGRGSANARAALGPGVEALAFDGAGEAVTVLAREAGADGANSAQLVVHRVDAATGRAAGPPRRIALADAEAPAALSGDGRVLVHAQGELLRRVDLRSGQPAGADLRAPQAAVIALGADATVLAAASRSGTLRVFRAGGGEPVVSELGGAVSGGRLALTQDGQGIVAVTAAPASRRGEALTLQARDVAAATPAASMPLGNSAGGLAATLCGLGPGGRLVAIDVGSGAVRVADFRSGRDVALVDEAGGTRRCAFSRDERWLAVPGVDRTVRIWDLASQAEVARLDEVDEIEALAFDADGRRLATLQRDGTLAIWPLLPGDLLARVCERLRSDLPPADWARFFGARPYRRACTSG